MAAVKVSESLVAILSADEEKQQNQKRFHNDQHDVANALKRLRSFYTPALFCCFFRFLLAAKRA